ncbi:MAG: hypothetical protein NZV14_01740 [Bryobacteraceae bacterium]|nr:hypothetical protein [Bryobacteraceae bacterium]MDW8376852.1 hypothetical protein [Bryobacterales bacterium]
MRIGLLLCDHVVEPLRSREGDYSDMFRLWLGPAFPSADWQDYDLTSGELPADPGECDLWLASGSKASVYEDEAWILAFAEFVRALWQAEQPFVGVCFGHQMIAHALGGVTAKNPGGWCVGVHSFELVATRPWMSPAQKKLFLPMSCQDQVQRLPPGAHVLATSARCPVAMFEVGKMMGIQGHPEWKPSYAEGLLKLRPELLGVEALNSALDTLSQPLDGALLAQWIAQWWLSLS